MYDQGLKVSVLSGTHYLTFLKLHIHGGIREGY